MRHHPTIKTVSTAAVAVIAILLPSAANAVADNSVPEPSPTAASSGSPAVVDNDQPGLDEPNTVAGPSALAEPRPIESELLTPSGSQALSPATDAIDYVNVDSDDSADPDRAARGQLENFWVRGERIINANQIGQQLGWDSPVLDSASVIGRRGTKWDALLRLTPDSKWASELRWTPEQPGEQSCLAQSSAAPLSGN